MPQLNPTVAWCALFCILTGPVLAQNAPQAESGPTIRATVNEVALDLVVRDKKGRLVKNLKPGDVEIYEDGVRQEIRSLRLVGGDEAPVHPEQQAQQPDQPSGGAEAGPAAATRQPVMPLPSLNLHPKLAPTLDPGTRKWAVAAAQDFIKAVLRPGAWVGVFNLDSRLTPLHAFTINRDEIGRSHV